MKNKLVEIENDNFFLKFIQNKNVDKKDKNFTFGICQFKNNKVVAFKYEFSLIYSFDDIINYLRNKCELVFELTKHKILLSNKDDLFYEEKMNKNMLKSFEVANFITSIPNTVQSYLKCDEMLQMYTKFAIQSKINFFSNISNIIPNEDNFSLLNSNIEKFKTILDKETITYSKNNEYEQLSKSISIFLEEAKKQYGNIINFIIGQKPNFNFTLKNNQNSFYSKENEYISIVSQKRNLQITFSPFNLKLIFPSKKEIYILYKNPNEFSIQSPGTFQIIYHPNYIFCGLIKDRTKYFGIEKQKNFTYIGYYKDELFNGYGIIISLLHIYRGNFIKSSKNDKNCKIFLKNHLYEGGIEKNELNGKGKYIIENDNVIEGNFSHGNIEGEVKFTFENGDTYGGNVSNKSKKGKWIYYSKENKIELCAVFDQNNNEITYDY